MSDLGQRIVDEARTWLGTRFVHQGSLKGVGVDCAGFISGVAKATGAVKDVEFEQKYRREENGEEMKRLLTEYLDEVEEIQTGDIVALCDELCKYPHIPRHLVIVTEILPHTLYIIHASQHGVREHRTDQSWTRRFHSIWRAREEGEWEHPSQKKQELIRSLDEGLVKDPVSILITTAISVGLSLVSYGVSRLFAPKPKPVERGRMVGELAMNSERGVMIPEIYGGDPGDGFGGARIAPQIVWTSGIRKHVTVTRQPTGGGKGGGGGGGGGQQQEVREITYDIDLFLQWARGPLLARRIWANADVLYSHDPLPTGTTLSYEAEAATLAGGAVAGVCTSCSGGQKVFFIGNGGTIQFSVTVAVTAIYRVDIHYTSPDVRTAQMSVNGAAASTVSFNASGINTVGIKTVIVSFTSGSNTLHFSNASDWAPDFDRIVVYLSITGVIDPTIPIDPPYDPEIPPDPRTPFLPPIQRVQGTLAVDGTSVRTGVVALGSNSGVAIYPGNQTQLQDPTMQASVDAQYGAGSTPAYRGRACTSHANFYLTRWGGVMPNFTGTWEHETVKTLKLLAESFCSRVNIAPVDYNFTDLTSVNVRGLRIAGRRYKPSEVLSQSEDVYDVFFSEPEGVVTGMRISSAPSVTIDDSEIGFIEEEREGPLSEVDTTFENEINLPRRVDVRFFDPEKDWEPNVAGISRQITDGEESETLDLEFTLTSAEARAVAQRRLYKRYVQGTTYRFTLSWKYLYLYPGYKIIVTRDEGFTHTLQLTSISGGIGVLECSGVALETSVFTQPAVGDHNRFEVPPVPIPAQTILALMDVPLLRDVDETNNHGIGFYAAGTPRTGIDQIYQGFSLYMDKTGWERIADFSLPATMGRQVLANGASAALPTVSDPSIWDRTNTITVDLYSAQTLSSAAETDVLNGQNACLVGDEVIQFATATQVDAYRWTLSTLLRGRKGTEYAVSTHVLNERFVLLNEAVKFVPFSINHVNQEFDFKAVSAAQSLDDAATVAFTWTGRTVKPLAPDIAQSQRNALGDVWIPLIRRTRWGGGMRPDSDVPLGEEYQQFLVEIYSGSTLLRSIPVVVGTTQSALLIGHTPGAVSGNNLLSPGAPGAVSLAYTIQQLHNSGGYIESTLRDALSTGFTNPFSSLCLIPAALGGTFALTSAQIDYRVEYQRNPSVSPNGMLRVYRNGTNVHTNSSMGGVDAVRIRALVSGTEVRFYQDYAGPGSVPFYVSPVAPNLPYRGYFEGATENTVENIFMGGDAAPSTIYSAAQQVADFGSVQSSIKIRAYQISALVGRGSYREVFV